MKLSTETKMKNKVIAKVPTFPMVPELHEPSLEHRP